MLAALVLPTNIAITLENRRDGQSDTQTSRHQTEAWRLYRCERDRRN